MTKRSKYATLDKRIVAAVDHGCRTHRRIYLRRGVWSALGCALKGSWGAARSLLSRRLQSLRVRNVLDCRAWDRWHIAERK